MPLIGEWSSPEVLAPATGEHGRLASVWLNSYSRKDGTFGHRLLIASQAPPYFRSQSAPRRPWRTGLALLACSPSSIKYKVFKYKTARVPPLRGWCKV